MNSPPSKGAGGCCSPGARLPDLTARRPGKAHRPPLASEEPAESDVALLVHTRAPGGCPRRPEGRDRRPRGRGRDRQTGRRPPPPPPSLTPPRPARPRQGPGGPHRGSARAGSQPPGNGVAGRRGGAAPAHPPAAARGPAPAPGRRRAARHRPRLAAAAAAAMPRAPASRRPALPPAPGDGVTGRGRAGLTRPRPPCDAYATHVTLPPRPAGLLRPGRARTAPGPPRRPGCGPARPPGLPAAPAPGLLAGPGCARSAPSPHGVVRGTPARFSPAHVALGCRRDRSQPPFGASSSAAALREETLCPSSSGKATALGSRPQLFTPRPSLLGSARVAPRWGRRGGS